MHSVSLSGTKTLMACTYSTINISFYECSCVQPRGKINPEDCACFVQSLLDGSKVFDLLVPVHVAKSNSGCLIFRNVNTHMIYKNKKLEVMLLYK